MPYKDLDERRRYMRDYSRKIRGFKGPQTHCKNGHEFTAENTYNPPGNPKKRMCRTCRSNNSKKNNALNKDRIAETRRERRRRYRMPSDSPESKRKTALKRIGWTIELFDKVILEQSNKCGFCGKEMNLEPKQNDARACADHEHINPPRPRGILCTSCNFGIGNLQDSIDVLRSAIAYMEKWG